MTLAKAEIKIEMSEGWEADSFISPSRFHPRRIATTRHFRQNVVYDSQIGITGLSVYLPLIHNVSQSFRKPGFKRRCLVARWRLSFVRR
jgi:hypothetical protein